MTLSLHNTSLIEQQDFIEIRSLSQRRCVFCYPHQLKVLLETDHFWVTLDSSPLVEGHILIHSKAHIGCAGEVESETFPELLEVKNQIGQIIRNIYGSVSFYEHGRAGHCGMTFGTNMRVCHHFHLHALPLAIDISPVLAESFDQIQLGSFKELPELYEQFGHYLYFESSKTEMFYYPVNKEIKPHFLRTAIANAVGFPERDDWQSYCNLEALNNCKEKLYNHFARHHNYG